MQGGTDLASQSKIILNMISTWATGLSRSSLSSLKCKVYGTYAIALFKHHAIYDRTLVSAGCPRAKLPQTPKDDCIDVFCYSFIQSVMYVCLEGVLDAFVRGVCLLLSLYGFWGFIPDHQD